MLLDDAIQDFRSTGVLPGALRIAPGYGASRAAPEAVGLGPVHSRFRPGQTQLLEPCFQKRPRFKASGFVAALGLCLVGAEKNMALNFFQPERCRNFFEMLVRHGLSNRL